MENPSIEEQNRATIEAVSNITGQHVHDFIWLMSGKFSMTKREYDFIECFVDTFIETSRYCALDATGKGEAMGKMFNRIKRKIREIESDSDLHGASTDE